MKKKYDKPLNENFKNLQLWRDDIDFIIAAMESSGLEVIISDDDYEYESLL